VLKSIAADGSLAIEATGVVKAFGEVTALAGIDLSVPAGTLTALLGPNGAGKTTLVRIVATLTRADRGLVRVLGYDVAADPGAVRARIGLTGQFAGLDDALAGRDNLILIGRLAGLRLRGARERAGELMELLGLTQAAGRAVRTYSGGMRRRLDLAASLMTGPPLLVLDEPTTGLDPASRQQLWESLAGLRAGGTTMLLTTQYLEEADRFADMVHVLDHGAVIASGTPAQLKSRVGGQVVQITLADRDTGAVAEMLRRRLSLQHGSVRAEQGSGRLTVIADAEADGDAGILVDVAAALRSERIAVADLGLRQPSLDEAFLALTSAEGVSS
jgi:ABC-type multidrug transport system ATPase subunit